MLNKTETTLIQNKEINQLLLKNVDNVKLIKKF